MRRMRRNKLGFLLPVFCIFVFLFSAGCANKQEPEKPVRQQLTFLLPTTPLSVDPAKLQDEAGFQFVTSLFEGLVRFEADGSLGKAMAQDWQISADGKKYLFTLRDAHWSNGESVTAYDFEAAIKRNLTPDNNCPYAYLLYDLKNAEAFHRSLDENYSGKKAEADQVGIKAEDEKTLAIELEKPEPAFLDKLAHPVFYPLPLVGLNDQEGTFFTPTGLVGNGPFRVVGAIADQGYELAKNEQYWDAEQVKLEKMKWLLPRDVAEEWDLFREQQVDLTANIPFAQIAAGLREGTLKSSPLFSLYSYQFNVAEKPLDDQRVRQALSFALDRGKLVAEFLKGGQIPAKTIIPAGMLKNQEGKNLPDGDIRKAQELLAAAGYGEGKGFPELELLISTGEGHRYLAEKIQQEWREHLGINVKITAVSWPELAERMQNRDYQLGLMGWSADYPDPVLYLRPYITGSGNNTSGWVSDAYDQLLKQALVAASEEERDAAFTQAEQILLEAVPVLPLYQYTKVYAVREGIEELFVSPLGTGFDFKAVYIAKPQD